MKQPQRKRGIMIDDDAWLGFCAIVLDGVRIGQGAVVGAGAVTHDVPDGAIVVGAPARVVNMRSNSRREEVDPLLELNRVIENNCATEVCSR